MTADRFLAVIGLCLSAVFIILLIKKQTPELAMAVSLSVVCVVGIFAAEQIGAVVDVFAENPVLTDNRYMNCVLKAVGIGLISQTASETCLDFGQSSVASKIDLCGKLAVLCCAMPMLETMLSLITEMVG